MDFGNLELSAMFIASIFFGFTSCVLKFTQMGSGIYAKIENTLWSQSVEFEHEKTVI